MRAYILLFINILLFFSFSISAQSPFLIPASVPKPEWVDKVNWEHPNIYFIDSVKKKYRPEEFGLDDKKEEPYEVAYIRWLRHVELFILPNGDIDLDAARRAAHTAKLQPPALQPRELQIAPAGILPSTETAAWSILGPVESFSSNTLRPWQTNIYSIAIAPSNPNILYAGSETGIIFKSSNKGLNWNSINDALISYPVTAIDVSPVSQNLVYAYSDGLLKTSDGGTTWSYLNSFSGGATNKIIIHPVSGRVVTASANGIFYSDNGGISWTRSSLSIATNVEFYDIIFHPTNPSIVYAVSAVSVSNPAMLLYRSIDAGNNFTIANVPSSTFTMGALLGVSSANPTIAYCITLENNFPKLLKSNDAGQNWGLTTTFTGTDVEFV